MGAMTAAEPNQSKAHKGFRPPSKSTPAYTIDRCGRLIDDLFEIDPIEFGRQDLGLLNLLCAPSLSGSENLDVTRCLARLDELTAYVKASTERNLYRFPSDPDFGHSEPMWRMALLVTLVKRNFGASYDPNVRADLEANRYSPFTDSRNVFIHGLLDDDPERRWGSCTSMPVLVVAVARRLRYPVGLAVTRRHVYARWDNGRGVCFNIEASNAAGMTVEPDEHYRAMSGAMTAEEQRNGLYVRSLYPAEEFALFLKSRVWCLHDTARYDETLLWAARALQLMPGDSIFAQHANEIAELGIKHRYRKKYPARPIPPPERNHEFFFDIGELLAVHERSTFLTIRAHYAERWGEIDRARASYVSACQQNRFGNSEQRDLQRFLRKHGPKRLTGPLLAPVNIGQPRYFKLSSPPEDEASELRRLAAGFEAREEFFDARQALNDLYLFDPTDAEVFARARLIERHPRFQAQLKVVKAERKRLADQRSLQRRRNTHAS